MNSRKISWDKQALNYFGKAIEYLRQDSPQNARGVKEDILEKIQQQKETLKLIPLINLKPTTLGNIVRSKFIVFVLLT